MNEISVDVNERRNFLSTLGLCARAGKLKYGVPMVCDEMRATGGRGIAAVIAPDDNSENTDKKLRDKCAFYGVELIRINIGGAELAKAIGKTASAAAVGITDAGFLKALKL